MILFLVSVIESCRISILLVSFSKIDNKLFWHASDLAFQFSYMEMCHKDKIGVLNFPSYVYNQYPKNQERTKQRESADNSIYENEIRNKRK